MHQRKRIVVLVFFTVHWLFYLDSDDTSSAALIGKIIERVYPAKSVNGLRPPTDLIEEIRDWRENVSPHLRLSDENIMRKAPPTILGLHMRYWCAIILLFRPL